jgi:hypothetical protein
LERSQGNPTYTASTLSKEEIVDNLILVEFSFFFGGLSVKDEDYNAS